MSPDDKLSPSQRRLWHIRHQTVWRLSRGDGQVFIVYDPLKGWEIGDGVMRCNIGATSIKYAVVRFTTRTGGCCLAVWKWIRRFFCFNWTTAYDWEVSLKQMDGIIHAIFAKLMNPYLDSPDSTPMHENFILWTLTLNNQYLGQSQSDNMMGDFLISTIF